MKLPEINQLQVDGKKVLVRADLDVDVVEGGVVNEKRLSILLPTLEKLLSMNVSQIVILGHRGRVNDENREQLSTKYLVDWFRDKLNQDVEFQDGFENNSGSKIVLFENLRYWPGEEENNEEFVSKLASLGDVYVNESFATSHREHSSIVGLPKKMPHAVGERFAQEVEHLSKLLENPERPFYSLLNGVKEDKLSYLNRFIEISDFVYVSGRLPVFMDEDYKHEKVYVCRLLQDKEDITLHSVERIEADVPAAKTILLSGPAGKYEEEGHRLGTKRVFEAIANSNAFKVAGGGDTEAAIEMLGLEDKFDWISIGGGAMLEFIANGTLPGIEALQ